MNYAEIHKKMWPKYEEEEQMNERQTGLATLLEQLRETITETISDHVSPRYLDAVARAVERYYAVKIELKTNRVED